MKEYMDIPFELETKEDGTETGIVKGYGSMFNGPPDSYGDIIKPGAFRETIKNNGHRGLGVAMLWQHNIDEPIGAWLDLTENNKGLQVRGQLTRGVARAEEALLLMKAKVIKSLSIGYTIPKDGYEFDDNKKIRYIHQIDLWEISPVTFPANARAAITGVKALEDAQNERELERALRDAGLSANQSKFMVAKCKPYLRELKSSRKGMKDVLKAIQHENAKSQARQYLQG